MNNTNPNYPTLVMDTVGKMLDQLEKKWQPYIKVSSPNDQANFMMHVAGSIIATITNNIAIATKGAHSTEEIIGDLFSSIQRTLVEHRTNPSTETH